MGTQANISVVHSDNTVSTIYLHYDGYPSYALEMLKEHYNSQEKADALVALGNLSVLNPSIECPEGHSFETPVKGYTIAYHRDRGEEWSRTQPSRTDYSYFERDRGYHYIFKNNEWQQL